ncbi:zinc finger protein 722-like [Hetaerina americana]|uniref:zinc finger protein 722-like n=1 Tax=Hetaerina americana TaxID=62018 RepID=UPI003A7F57B4
MEYVVEDANHPWLVCSNCMEKLTEFRLFKRRCRECLSVFYNRIQKKCNPATKDRKINREEFHRDFKKKIDDKASDTVESIAVDVQDNMIIVKEEVDTASWCSGKDVVFPIITSMQEGGSHWSGNDEAGNLDPLPDGQLSLSFHEEVDIKEEYDVAIPVEQGCMGANLSQAQRDVLEGHVMDLHPVKMEEIRCDVDAEAFECSKEVESDAMTYKCTICARAFSLKHNLKRHMVVHTGEKPHKCKICLKGFNHKQTLESHMLTHSGARPHECKICAKTFTLKQHLKDHVRIHTGEDLHKCEVCLKTFVRKQSLKSHMFIHTGERPYKCEICSTAFRQKHHLTDHVVTHGDRPHQ